MTIKTLNILCLMTVTHSMISYLTHVSVSVKEKKKNNKAQNKPITKT